MRKNKMGSLFLISVLALAGIGISYAGWTDTITVTGTVSTGDVDIDVVAYSGTWVYKIPEHGLERIHEIYTAADLVAGTTHTPPVDFINIAPNGWVAAAWAEPDPDYPDEDQGFDDGVEVYFTNLFPCQDFTVDFILHYEGSVPARLQGPILIDTFNPAGGELPEDFKDNTDGYDWLEYLWYVETADGSIADGGIGVKAIRCDPDPNGGWIFYPEQPVDVGDQFEYCDYIYVELTIHIPQDPDYQALSGGFSTEFEVIQWNEFGTTGGCGDEPPIGHHADVMLCMDRSGSIDDDPLVPPIWRAAAQGFIAALLGPDDGMIGIASFAASGSLDHILSTNIGTLNTAIDNLAIGGGTNLAAGILFARTELEGPDRTPDADYPDYMVIITDGEANLPSGTAIVDAEFQAAAAKTHGIRIFVFGIGSSLSPTTKTWLQNTIASSPGDYYEGDWTVLQTLLESLV